MRTHGLVLILAAAGCNNVTSQEPASPPTEGGAPSTKKDGGAPDVRAPSNEPPSTITGAQVAHYINEQGEQEVIPNLTALKVAAWSITPEGEYKFFPGSGTADGHISVPDVPGGPFVLRVGSTYLADSKGREFDLDTFGNGRPGRLRATRPMTLSLDLTGLDPWQIGDRLVFYAPSVLANEVNVQNRLVPTLAAGAVAATGVVDYSTFGDPYLIDGPGRGEEAWLTHQSNQTSCGLYLSTSSAVRASQSSRNSGVGGVLPFSEASRSAAGP